MFQPPQFAPQIRAVSAFARRLLYCSAWLVVAFVARALLHVLLANGYYIGELSSSVISAAGCTRSLTPNSPGHNFACQRCGDCQALPYVVSQIIEFLPYLYV